MKRFTFGLAGLTFALVVLGGIVHNTGSSLACPDWPLCNGQAFPRMVGAVLIEHGHRLTALAVAMSTLGLFVWAVVRGSDAGVTKASGLALFLVLVQAALGAITVKFRLPPLVSTGHLTLSMLYFSTVIYIGLRLRQNAAPALPARIRSLTLAAALVVFAQMVLGAAVRHLGAGLVCRELYACSWLGADVTMQLHMLHRLSALLVLALVGWASFAAFRAGTGPVRILALLGPLLVITQMTLGLLTIVTYRDFIPLTAHLGVAALLLADVFALHLLTRGPLTSAERNRDEVPLAVTA
jgi:heme A synthase